MSCDSLEKKLHFKNMEILVKVHEERKKNAKEYIIMGRIL